MMILWLQWHTVLLDVVWTESHPKRLRLDLKSCCQQKDVFIWLELALGNRPYAELFCFSEPTLEYPVTLFPKYVPEVILCTTEETIDHPMAHETKGW